MAQLRCTTGEPVAFPKPKIYLFHYSEPRAHQFEALTQALLACRDCEVFWTDEHIPTQERHRQLAEMQLFILPVNYYFLTEPTEEEESDIAFAYANNIPLLPVLMEADLLPLYSLPHKFGETPCLRFCREPDTFISFSDGLKLALSSLLPPDALVAEAAGDLKAMATCRRKDLLRGLAFFYGIRTQKRISKGLKLLHKAALAGDRDAAVCLLRIYAHGIGVPANRQLALHFSHRLMQELVSLESLRFPEQLPEYYPDVCQLCIQVDRADLAMRLMSKLVEALCCTLGDSHALSCMHRDVLLSYCSRYRQDDFWMWSLCQKQHQAVSELYGSTHPEALARLRCLAFYTRKDQNHDAALQYYKTIYEVCCDTLGEEAEETLIALRYVAAQCKAMHKNRHAEALSRISYDLLLKAKGRHYPETLEALEVLCDSLFESESRQELGYLVKRLHVCRRLALGKAHPKTLDAQVKLALFYSSDKQKARAVRTITAAYESYKHFYGAEHPKTVEAKEMMEYMKRQSEEET